LQGDDKADEKFKEATEAYEVLSDESQRNLYDQFGHAGVDPNSGFGQQQGGNPFGGGFPGAGFGDGSFHFSGGGGDQIDPDELFEAFFGGGRRRPRGPRPGADLQMHVNISFKEAVFGMKKDLNLRYQIRDPSTGQVDIKERDVVVDIPAGIDNGMNLRLAGQGAEGDPGAARGNLLVHVVVDDDQYFIRDGYDVHTEVPISLTQAVLGGTVDVTTLTGEVEMKIPKGCQVDTKLMLRSKGITRLHSTAQGNQIVHLKIEIPKSISARQEELLREFDEETKACGNGISGKLAEAVGSAFSSLFGSKKDEKKKAEKKKDKKKKDEKAKKEKDDQKDDDDDEDTKKQAAQ
jgi:DnaJ-class molecular chaperone